MGHLGSCGGHGSFGQLAGQAVNIGSLGIRGIIGSLGNCRIIGSLGNRGTGAHWAFWRNASSKGQIIVIAWAVDWQLFWGHDPCLSC